MVSATLLGDIAGQVTANSVDADKVTVAVVYLPSGRVNVTRAAFPHAFPKWRDAENQHVEFMVDLMLREGWSICAASMDKTARSWKDFWEDAKKTHAGIAAKNGGSISTLKAAHSIKFLLITRSAARTLTHSITVGTLPTIRDRKGRRHVSDHVIFDNEIHGHENQDAFVGILRALNSYQPMLNSLGIYQAFERLTLTTETRERLLLLPDYAAGIVHAVNSTADTLSRSQVSPVTVNRAFEKMKSSPKFCEFEANLPRSYFEIFPDFAQYSRGSAP